MQRVIHIIGPDAQAKSGSRLAAIDPTWSVVCKRHCPWGILRREESWRLRLSEWFAIARVPPNRGWVRECFDLHRGRPNNIQPGNSRFFRRPIRPLRKGPDNPAI